MKKILALAFGILFSGIFMFTGASAQEVEIPEEEIEVETFEKDNSEIKKNSAKEEFNRMQRSPEKNHRKYKIALTYLKQFLEPEDFKKGDDPVKASDLTFDVIALRLEEKIVGNDQENEELWKELSEEYEKLENLFHDAQQNTVQELRHSIANGGILPGSRNVQGTKYVGETVIPKLINTLLVLALSVSTLLIIVAGGMYVFSYGADETKQKAKDIIFWTIVGTVIMVVAYAAVKFVININFEI